MTSTRYRSVAALAAAALLLAPLAGCGGSDDKKPVAGKSSATATDTAGAVTGKTVDKDEFLAKVVDAMKGKTSAHMKISGGSTLNADADLTFGVAKPAIQLTANFGGQKVQLIAADNALFIQQGAGGKFVKVGADDPTYGSLLKTFSNFGPQSSIDGIKSGVTKVVEVGTSSVGGQALTQYAVTANTSKATGAIKSLAGSAGGDVVLRFFLDSDNLLHQIGLDLNGQKATVTFTDWDKPVTIKVPTGNQLLTPGS
jgi:hypothetical protein